MAGNANPRLLRALAFAVERHGAVAQERKGTTFPYVVHPIRVAWILDQFGYSAEIVMAGLLHDTTEDAGLTRDALAREFGERVAELVEKASEPDRSLSWRVRKEHSIARVATEDDPAALALVAADKLDNVRSLKDTLRAWGEEKTWRIFRTGRKDQRWYYRTMTQALLDREPANLLTRTLDAEVHSVFPDERRSTRFFAGKPLGNAQDVRAFLADPIKHWRPRYSAFELASAWISSDRIPASVDRLLHDAFGEFELVEGFFEKQTRLDDFGRPSQTDLLLLLRANAQFGVVGIEGKGKEGFGPLVSAWKGNERRLAGLCDRLGLTLSDVGRLRYQLLHRTVATFLEAERYGAGQAMMLVHSFDARDGSLDDYRAFATALGLSNAQPNALTSSKTLGRVALRLGWAKQAKS